VEAETEIDRVLIHPNKTEDLNLKIILHILTQRQIGHKVLVREVGEVHPKLSEISLQGEEEEISLQEEEEEVQVAEEDSHQEIEEDPEVGVEIAAIFLIPAAVIFIHQW